MVRFLNDGGAIAETAGITAPYVPYKENLQAKRVAELLYSRKDWAVEMIEEHFGSVARFLKIRFLNDEKALTEMPSILAALALGLVIFLAIVIVGGLIIGNFLAVGQDSLANLNESTANTLQTTWDNLVSVYAMFGTWAPIIFIALFAVLVITAVVGLRGVGGAGSGGGF